MEKHEVIRCVLSLYVYFSIVYLQQSDAKLIKKNMVMELSNIGPYVSSPFSMAPYDSLPPTSLPQNTPPFCVYSPPSTLSTTNDSTPQPILPGPTQPILSPPNSGPILPGPTQPVSPPNSQPIIGPPNSQPSPPRNTPSIPSPRFLPPVVYPPPTVPPPPPRRAPATALWCVAKASVPEPIIQEAMNYACGSGADCGGIQANGACFEPNTVFAHASYAFNSYWQRTKVTGGTCDFGGTALLVTVDPSYDGCHFVYF